MHLMLCFLPCRQAQDARHLCRREPQDTVRFTGAVLGQGFSPCLLLCYKCLGPDSALHSLAFRGCSSSRSLWLFFTLCSLSLSAGPGCQASTLLGPLLELQFLDKLFSPVVVQRQVPFMSDSAVIKFLLRYRGLFHADHSFPQLLRTSGRLPLLCRLCSFPGGLQVLNTLTTCPLLVTTEFEVGQWFRSCSSLVVSDIAVVAGAGSFGPDCLDEQCGRRLGLHVV